ncbi:hypothetical protein HCA61_22175 [Rhodococcus sp. HNM0563]|uniref:hypothetical protein n=1 Tax=Rhodococcus sp. HNM0563 TaxID=2716339 RepID=UPI00146F385E|nr:hypothetical protein [Rhodococcus sp. HNM0563]NLU64948.1 hypothetical protein [Rhodococcus sp. HNM0563]
MRTRTVSSLHLCPSCGHGIVRARSLTAREITDGAPQDNLAVIGCCATHSDPAIVAVYVPAATVATWPVITADTAIDSFCPDCGDTATGCKYLQREVTGLAELVEARARADEKVGMD